MVRGKIRVVAHRRRREGRTNFRKRLSLVKSGKKRLVVRKTANSMVCQIVDYRHNGDMTLVSATTKDLSAFGWKGGTGNLPGSYLVGYLCAVRAREKKIGEAILDIGLQRSTKGSRVYAALKGALDGGINVPFSEDILPSDERIRGVHIQGIAEKNPAMLSELKKSGVDAKNMGKHFDEIKAKISKAKPLAAKPVAKKSAAKKTVLKKSTKKAAAPKAAKKPALKKAAKKAAPKKAKK